MKPAIKCVNLDWLEVFCLEPADMPAQYFQNLGWQVNVRFKLYLYGIEICSVFITRRRAKVQIVPLWN